MAAIHSQLSADCISLGRFSLCHLLLMNDSNYPWFILVPDRDDIREMYQLDTTDREQLLDESCRLSEFIMSAFEGEIIGKFVPNRTLRRPWPRRNSTSSRG